jgi:hypothetical protein
MSLAAFLSALLSGLAVTISAAAAEAREPAFSSALSSFRVQPSHRATASSELSSQNRPRRAAPGGRKAAPKARPKAGQTAKPSAKPAIPPRQPFTATDQERAVIAGFPDARFWADSPAAFLQALTKPSEPKPSETIGRTAHGPSSGPWLVLSTGGEDGAYGAGLLAGWAATGKRPDFTVVTGVSTGALMAPFVFAGPQYDGDLRTAYTTIGAVDIFEIGGREDSLFDTWPLKDLIKRLVTDKLLADIAAEHARGRRLFVLTTNLDAGRPVAWDIGAIATRRNPQALALVRNILLAASSIPGAFPPVLIAAEAGGKQFEEMHADGGLGAQFYVAPDALQASTSDFRLPASELFIIINMKLAHDFHLTERSLSGILSRSIAAAIRVVTRNTIDRAYMLAQRSEVPFHLAFVDEDFSAPHRGAFDSNYMKALFEFGYTQGKDGSAFHREPPRDTEQPASPGPKTTQ